MGKLKRDWEHAKRKCPEFAKLETKPDLGRALDKIEPLKEEIEKDLLALCKKLKIWKATSGDPLRTIYQHMRTAGTPKLRESKGISEFVSDLGDIEKRIKSSRKEIQDETRRLIECL